MYRSKKKPKISEQVALSQGELVSEGPLGLYECKEGGNMPSRKEPELRNLPTNRIIWIKITVEVRMSDPDLEKNNILFTQYKLAIVTIISVTHLGNESLHHSGMAP